MCSHRGSQVWKWQRAELGLDPRRDRPRTLTGVEASHLRRGLGAHLLRPFSPVLTPLLLKLGFAGVAFGFSFFSKFLLKHFSLFLIDRDQDQ